MDDPAIQRFDVHGLAFEVTGDRPEVVADARRDYSWFADDSTGGNAAAIRVVLHAEPLDRARLPRMPATLMTPRNMVFRDGDLSYLDYAGRAIVVHDRKARRYDVHGGPRDLAHEIVFLTMLSEIGAHLDAGGLHRVHALGVEAHGKATIVLLPMGGGKTSLALRLLRADGVRLLSEDSPLIGADGRVHPFPIRIGVRPGGVPEGIPPEACRTVQRMEFGPKTLIDVTHFEGHLGRACAPGAILLGERWSRGESFIRPIRRSAAMRAMIRDCVVGLGLYQGVEFVLRSSGWELVNRAGLALARWRAARRLVARSRIYRFGLGGDVDETAETLRRFLVDGYSTEATT